MGDNETGRLGRRALLAGGVVGLAAAAARAMVAPLRVSAQDGDPLVIGSENTSSSLTELHGYASQGALEVAGRGGDGLIAETSAPLGRAVFGSCSLVGTSGTLGAYNGGVTAYSMNSKLPAVKGEALWPGANAVEGKNEEGGTFAALGAGKNALLASAPLDTSHFGLAVSGRAHFSRSGTLTIAKDESVVSAPMAALTPDTVVLATLQANRSGVYIQAAMVNRRVGKIVIYLNKPVPTPTKVAYFVLD